MRRENTQLNIRSAFARARAQDLARQTGLTATQIVEDALRAYVPSASAGGIGRLVRRGPVLVLPGDDSRVTLAAAEAALDATRDRLT